MSQTVYSCLMITVLGEITLLANKMISLQLDRKLRCESMLYRAKRGSLQTLFYYKNYWNSFLRCNIIKYGGAYNYMHGILHSRIILIKHMMLACFLIVQINNPVICHVPNMCEVPKLFIDYVKMFH